MPKPSDGFGGSRVIAYEQDDEAIIIRTLKVLND